MLQRSKRQSEDNYSMDSEIALVFDTFQCTASLNGLTPVLSGTKIDTDLKTYKESYNSNYSVLLRDIFTNSVV